MVSLSSEYDVRRQVQEFYDNVGWQQIGEGLYQNARYEDLRPVTREYIMRCHRRVAESLPASGGLLLDAGSGPIQYSEYLEYSAGFERRICLDLSLRALVEARQRIGEHGLFVVGDISRLPFAIGAFDAVVSMHTIHHVPFPLQIDAFDELYRVQREGAKAAIVHSWGSHSALMRFFDWPRRTSLTIRAWVARARGRRQATLAPEAADLLSQPGTYTHHPAPEELERALAHLPGFKIRVWRSVSTSFTRAFVDPRLFGQELLRFIYWIEDLAPHALGRWGQYPLITYSKPQGTGSADHLQQAAEGMK